MENSKIYYVKRSIRVGEINGLAQAILKKKVLLGEATDEHLLELLTELEFRHRSLSAVINEERVLSKTEADIRSLKLAYIQLHQLVESYANIVGYEHKDAAQRIWKVMLHFSDDIVKSTKMMLCSSVVKALVLELEKAEYASDLARLLLVDVQLENLKAMQNAFISNYANYRTWRTLQIDRPNASQLRMELLGFINVNLIGYLNAMAAVKRVDYSAFSDAVRGIVAGQNTIVKRRMGRSYIETN